MKFRIVCAGGTSLLLSLACGPRVEIGHGPGAGNGGDAGTSAASGSGGKFAPEEGGSSAAGEPGLDAGAGGTVSEGGSSTTTGLTGGPAPADDGPQAAVDKVDLLLAIDNSISMGTHQKLLAQTVPELLSRLVSPYCVNGTGAIVSRPAAPDSVCPPGSQREFEPLRDLHVGVITSSLGSHGTSDVRDVCISDAENDKAHLIPSVRPDVPSYDDKGFLKWDPDGLGTPPGENDAQAFASSLATMLQSVGESGCGYEAQLESVYRFLVDPNPPKSVTLKNNLAVKVGTDTDLLRQREAFLRPDSSVVVLMLTDENDCSIQDQNYGWLVARAAPMYRSTSACATSANDPCCQSCGESRANAGCPPIEEDSECRKGSTLESADDQPNLRCFDQKRRFGFEVLYPTARYVNGFGDGTVPDRNGKLVQNPLFHRNGQTRDRSLFTLAVIGGVPWQDIATPASLTSETLEFLNAPELEAAKRWPLLIGDPSTYSPPEDPFMRESMESRSGTNPIIDASIVASTSEDPEANPINGHEQETFSRDLQYACTFRLPEPVVCDSPNIQGCVCHEEDLASNRPVCQPPEGGAATTTQYYGKAYPGLRELTVARELGRRSVLGSVCARNIQDDTRADYGYRPVFGAIGRRIAATLTKP